MQQISAAFHINEAAPGLGAGLGLSLESRWAPRGLWAAGEFWWLNLACKEPQNSAPSLWWGQCAPELCRAGWAGLRKGRDTQMRPLQPWLYGLIMPRVLNQSHLALERKAMMPLSAWWSWVQQPCMNMAEESCCPQRFPSPNAWHGKAFVGLEASGSVLGTPAAGQGRVAARSSLLTRLGPFYRELEKGQCLLERKDTPQGWTGASEGCAGQGGIPGWKVCFHICFVPSLHLGDIACSPLQPPAPHPSPGSSRACPSSLPACPSAARGEPEGQGQALSAQVGSRAPQKPAAGSPPMGPAATSSHHSALHFPPGCLPLL